MQSAPGLVVGPTPKDDDAQNQRTKTLSDTDRMQIEAEIAGLAFIPLFDSLIQDRDYLAEITQNDDAHPLIQDRNMTRSTPSYH